MVSPASSRRLRLLRVTIVVAVCWTEGCSDEGKTNRDQPKPARTNTDERDVTPAPFDPKLTLSWPTQPKENRDEAGGTHTYTAKATVKRQSGVALFMVVVTTYSESDLQRHSPRELVESAALGSKASETSRRVVELTQRKYPGLELTKRLVIPRGKQVFSRDIIYFAGTRLTMISVSGPDETYIESEEVDAFFKSLKVED